MSSALGLIFSNIHDDNVPELTAKRTVRFAEGIGL